MNLTPLLGGIAAASGGSAILCYLKLREIVDHSWGIFPADEACTWTWGLALSLIICLVTLIIVTGPDKES